MRYQQTTYSLFLTLIFIVLNVTVCISQENFLDDFNPRSYSGNDGTQNWSSNWIENNDNNNVVNGRILVLNSGARRLRFEDITRNSHNIYRNVNLSAYSNAYLTFDWETIGLDSDGSGNINNRERLDIQISSDGGFSYTTVGFLIGTGTGTFSLNITSYISPNVRIRFVNFSPWAFGDWEAGEFVFIDNFQIRTPDPASAIITNGTINTCSNTFSDSGSALLNYENNENYTYTICPDVAGSKLSTEFTSFDVEAPFGNTLYDYLEIYDGNSTTAPLIGRYFNGNPPGTVIASNPSGCLTFRFISDTAVNLSGWEATITCVDTVLSVNDITINESAGTATFNISLFGNVAGGFTVDYQTVDGTAYADSDYTTTVGSLTFAGTNGENYDITVPIIDNAYAENDEIFYLNLLNPTTPTIPIKNGTATITDDTGDTTVPVNVPLALFDEFNGHYDYSIAGDAFRTSITDECAITNTSTNINLNTAIPLNATIDKAYLLWAHSGPRPDDAVTFEGQTVIADIINESSFNGASVYGMISDVSTIIQGITDLTNNPFDLNDLKIDNGSTYCDRTVVLGGWSLMVFYTEPTLPAVSINFYRGFDGQRNTNTEYTLSGFFAIGSTGSKTTILSWEGDTNITGGESLEISTGLAPAVDIKLVGDGNNNGTTLDNPFNSTVYDDTGGTTINRTTYGLDLDTYDISAHILQGESSVTTKVNVGNDFVALNAVLLKVPSNLITGRVFEDINYGGGPGRDLATSNGVGLANTRVELYDAFGNFEDFDITDTNGNYNIGGMANGVYNLRVANTTIRSNRNTGPLCGSCIPVQTYRVGYNGGGNFDFVTDEIGGSNPSGVDTPPGSAASPQLFGAQSSSIITISNEGLVAIDFGFNFNTIVNTNTSDQGSLEQFIINSNNLNNTGLDIEPHPNNSTLDPVPGEDTSIFMIPPTGDPFGRTADANYNANGFFDINMGTNNLTAISSPNTTIDGRTQTAYSGNTNNGITVSSGSLVGVGATALPDFEQPEIQIRRASGSGYGFNIASNNTTIRNLAIYGNSDGFDCIEIDSGSDILITENYIGTDALGDLVSNYKNGVLMDNGGASITNNYVANADQSGVRINTSTTANIQNNHFFENGRSECDNAIRTLGGTGILIEQNLIEDSGKYGIDNGGSTDVTINQNTIRGTGSANICTEAAGIRILTSSTEITENNIHNNGETGIYFSGGASTGNLISRNSIFANGTNTPGLGIDFFQNGTTLNDSGDGDSGPNGLINFPVFESASIRGTRLTVTGWSRPNATIELFLTDIDKGTAMAGSNTLGLTQDYGEGQIFLASVVEGSTADTDATTNSSYTDVDGNTDTTNKFSFDIILPNTIPVRSLITATATIANSTSEFSSEFELTYATVITNRRITYRVTPSFLSRGIATGRKTTDIFADTFQEGDGGSTFDISLRNITASPIPSYSVLIENAPYATIPSPNFGNHTLQTFDNGDGTYNHLFTSTVPLPGNASTQILGGVPSPAGTGITCGCISFYIN